MSTSPTWTIVGTKAAPTPGRQGRRSCLSATRAVTSEFASTSAPSVSRQIRSLHRRLHLARSLAGPLPRTGCIHRTCPVLRRDPHREASQRLPEWLDAVRNDNLPGLHTLAAGIDRDRDAVIAGLALPWNSGVVEGHVNRTKMLKRQMFGRAGFLLLRSEYCSTGDRRVRTAVPLARTPH
ncbi:transposase [Streptomyces griseoruber]|uniref:transposase n=1 Tax=Streptomyces griseoruber TaxID=1943 RepID=UPI0037B24D9A